jgi:hypothetical protein
MSDVLEKLDERFVRIYEAARAERLAHEKRKGLIVVQDDVLLLYRGDEPVRQFTGLEPPLYDKMKTLGHVPLAVFSLLHAVDDGPLSPSLKARLVSYRRLLDSAGAALDVGDEVKAGILPRPVDIHAMAMAFLGTVLGAGAASRQALHGFTRGVCDDVDIVLAVAAKAQLEAVERVMAEVRALLTPKELADLRVLASSISTATISRRHSSGSARRRSMPRRRRRSLATDGGSIATCSPMRRGSIWEVSE